MLALIRNTSKEYLIPDSGTKPNKIITCRNVLTTIKRLTEVFKFFLTYAEKNIINVILNTYVNHSSTKRYLKDGIDAIMRTNDN